MSHRICKANVERRIPTSTKLPTSRAIAGSRSCTADAGGVYHINGHEVTKAVYESVRNGVPLVAAVDAPFNPKLPVKEFAPACIQVGCATPCCPCPAAPDDTLCAACKASIEAALRIALYARNRRLWERASRRRHIAEVAGLIAIIVLCLIANSSTAVILSACGVSALGMAWLWIATRLDECNSQSECASERALARLEGQ